GQAFELAFGRPSRSNVPARAAQLARPLPAGAAPRSPSPATLLGLSKTLPPSAAAKGRPDGSRLPGGRPRPPGALRPPARLLAGRDRDRTARGPASPQRRGGRLCGPAGRRGPRRARDVLSGGARADPVTRPPRLSRGSFARPLLPRFRFSPLGRILLTDLLSRGAAPSRKPARAPGVS